MVCVDSHESCEDTNHKILRILDVIRMISIDARVFELILNHK